MSTHPVASSPAASVTAAILAVGDEVLRGEIINSNAAYLGDRLFSLGFDVVLHLAVSDRPDDIKAALQRLGLQADLVVVTGGLGPTDDDRTVGVVCELLGVNPIQHESSLEAMRAWFSARDYALTPNNLKQTEIPAGSDPLPNPAGLAPGFGVQLGRARCFFMPGVPREMRRIFETHVVARAQKLIVERGAPVALSRTFHIFGMGESHIDHRLQGIEDGCPPGTVAIHYRTANPENHVRVVVRDADPKRGQETLDRLDNIVHERLGSVIYGIDDDTFISALRRTFMAARKRLAIAESCTGGLAGQLVTHEPGASGFFAGGVVAYENDVKERVLGVESSVLRVHGAVSEPCAAQMATGVRRLLNVDVAVAITGIAGDSLHDLSYPQAADSLSSEKPVGTVCFAVADGNGVRTETRQFSAGRDRVRNAAAYHALELARRAVLMPVEFPSSQQSPVELSSKRK
jgi:nicotinamide-nucleotide amidase